MAKVGRPKKKLDYKIIEDLVSIFCTQEEIAGIMNVCLSKLTHDKEFMHIYKKGMDTAKSSLRRTQWKYAQLGNPTLLIWLGKQYLGQRDGDQINPESQMDLTKFAEAMRDADTTG